MFNWLDKELQPPPVADPDYTDELLDDSEDYEIPPVAVHVASAEPTRQVAPEFGSCMTWSVLESPPTQLLTRRYRRSKAKLIIVAWNGATGLILNSKQDSLTLAVPVGFRSSALGALPDWESQQPLYAVAIGGAGPVIVSVIDESYSETASV